MLAGGVGGARLAHGLLLELPPHALGVVVNVGDDTVLHGLHVSPDLDTVLYTLSGLADEHRGWGVRDESTATMTQMRALGEDVWFWLGDRDLALHIVRSARMADGATLSEVTQQVADALGIAARLRPATDDPVRTIVQTPEGDLAFQEYFVRRQHRDAVTGLRFEGAEAAHPAAGVLEAIGAADVLVIAPSNPFLSIDPILAVPGIREAVVARAAPTVAVSPIVGGAAIKGPAAAIMASLGHEVSALGVARLLAPIVDVLVIDHADAGQIAAIEDLGMRAVPTDAIMQGIEGRARLARDVLEAAR